MTEDERIETAKELLIGRSDDEREQMRELYRLTERKKYFRRSALIFAFAILFCIIPAVLPFEAMGLTTPAPMVITVFSLLLALVITIVSIVSFLRSMDAVSKLTEEERELRGTLIYVDMMLEISENMKRVSADIGEHELSESPEEYIARRNAEQNDVSEDVAPIPDVDGEEEGAPDEDKSADSDDEGEDLI